MTTPLPPLRTAPPLSYGPRHVHTAKVSYSQMQTAMQTLGYDNVFIGTVEGEPEDTACDAVIEKVKEAGYTKVILRPLMVVAGDHANNDMAGAEDDSWLSQFTPPTALRASTPRSQVWARSATSSSSTLTTPGPPSIP